MIVEIREKKVKKSKQRKEMLTLSTTERKYVAK